MSLNCHRFKANYFGREIEWVFFFLFRNSLVDIENPERTKVTVTICETLESAIRFPVMIMLIQTFRKSTSNFHLRSQTQCDFRISFLQTDANWNRNQRFFSLRGSIIQPSWPQTYQSCQTSWLFLKFIRVTFWLVNCLVMWRNVPMANKLRLNFWF